MTEHPLPTTDTAAPARTGLPSVDAVLDLVAGLEHRPLEEHVEVFETAHGELRRTLDQA